MTFEHIFEAGATLSKKLLLWFFGTGTLFTLIYGCHNMAKEMSDGEILYRAKCSSCHNIIEPGHCDKEKWLRYIDKYGQQLTTEERQMVLQYLVNSG